MNVDPYSNNRVKLRVPAGYNDYINASPIAMKHTRTGKVRRFIATQVRRHCIPRRCEYKSAIVIAVTHSAQGPTQITLSHFWRMVWHETGPVAVIVMLTQTHESGTEKCYQYFPMDSSRPTLQVNLEDEFRDGEKATVTLLESHYSDRARCTVRKLSMRMGAKEKIVWHLLFVGWPDFLVPEGENKKALLELVKLSAQLNRQGGASAARGNVEGLNPRIVHCSAGVGRSGTFIALDYLIEELEDGALESTSAKQDDRIAGTVDALRRQRMLMVQAEPQLKFLYDVLREKWVEMYGAAGP